MTLTQWLLLPAFVHVAMVYGIGGLMGQARVRAARSGAVKISDIAVDNSRWPEEARKIGNNFQNQFEVPVLFYAVLAMLLATSLADSVEVVLAWVFVASRVVHSAIHLGANVVVRRFQAFVFGFTVVALMWAWLAIRLYVIG